MNKERILKIVFEAIDKASPTINSISDKLGGLGGPLMGVAKIGEAAFRGLAAGVGVASAAIMDVTSEAANFEQAMANVKAVLPLTGTEYAKLSDEVLRLGRETRFTALQAAEAVEALARGGASFEDIMAGAGTAALNLAAATKSGMDEAARVIMSVMHQFNLTGDELKNTIDGMAGAVNHANMNLTDFQYALMATGSLASDMGLGIDEVSAALAQFGQQGYVGERAGTGLKILLTNLVPLTKTAKDAFDQYGFSINGVNQFFDQTTGKIRPLGDVFQLLQDKLGGLDTEERVAAMVHMFGKRAATIGMVLDAAKRGKEGYQEFLDVIHNTSAAQAAEDRMDSLKGAWERFSGEMETAKVVLGQAFLPIARGLAEWAEHTLSSMQPLIRAFSDWLKGGLEKLPGILMGIFGIDPSKLAAGLKPLQDFIAGLGAGDLTSGDKKLLGSFDIDTTPARTSLENIGPVLRQTIDGIFGAGTMDKVDGFVKGLQDIGRWLSDPTTIQGAKDLAAGIADIMVWVTSAEGQSSIHAVADGLAVLGGILGQMVAFLGGENAFGGLDEANATFERLGYIIQNLGPAIQTFLSDAVANISVGIGLWIAEVQARGAEIVADVQAKWTEVSTNVSTKLSEIGTSISTKWTEFVTEIQTKLSAILSDVVAKWDEIKNTISQRLEDIWSDIRLKWDAVLREIRTKLSAILDSVVSKWNEISNTISTKLSEILSTARTKFEELLASARQKFDEIKASITEKINAARDAVVATLSNLVTEAVNRWNQMVADVRAKWEELKAAAIAKVTELKDRAVQIAQDILNSLRDKWNQMVSDVQSIWGRLWDRAREALDSLLSGVRGFASDVANAAMDLGKSLVEGLWDGVTNMTGWLMDKISGWVAGLIGGVHDAGGGGSPWKKMIPIGMMAAAGWGVGFQQGMLTQQEVAGKAVNRAISYVMDVTEEQLAMLKAPFTLGQSESGVDRYRALRHLGMDMGRTGRGGFVAASAQNYYDIWARRNNLALNLLPNVDQKGGTTTVTEPGGATTVVVTPPPAPKDPAQPTTIVLEVGGVEIGRWVRAETPEQGRQADRYNT